jgi:putative salt-induced outer membrane protein YdiY
MPHLVVTFKSRMVAAVIVIALITTPAIAGVVTLKSGERVIGTWVNVQNGAIAFTSETLGQVKIPLAKVKSFAPSKPAVIIRKNKSTAAGKLELLPSGDWQITQNGRAVVVPAAQVQIIMPQTAYNALTIYKTKILHDWKGTANLGYNIQSGNQQADTISANVAAVRERPTNIIFFPHFRTTYSLVMLFSRAEQNGTEVTSNTLTTSLREDYVFTAANFVFVSGELDHIQTQGLYLQQTYGGGFGRELIHTTRTTFNLLAGLTFVSQKFYTGGPAKQNAEILAGESLAFALTKRIQLTHMLNFYPEVTAAGQYNFQTNSSLVFKLNARFTANLSLVDDYLSNPTPGNHKNNVALTAGLGIVF